jgi:hypothetical protein
MLEALDPWTANEGGFRYDAGNCSIDLWTKVKILTIEVASGNIDHDSNPSGL